MEILKCHRSSGGTKTVLFFGSPGEARWRIFKNSIFWYCSSLKESVGSFWWRAWNDFLDGRRVSTGSIFFDSFWCKDPETIDLGSKEQECVSGCRWLFKLAIEKFYFIQMRCSMHFTQNDPWQAEQVSSLLKLAFSHPSRAHTILSLSVLIFGLGAMPVGSAMARQAWRSGLICAAQ